MADIKLKNKSGVPIGYTDVDVISVPDLDTDDNIEYRNVELGTLNVTSNGEYTPSGNNVWNKVNANVPNIYTQADEGKVVHNGNLVLQNDVTVSSNGVKDTTLIKQLTVNVPTYGAADVGKVVEATLEGYDLVAQTSHATVTSNGQYDTTYNDSIDVQVPNTISYTRDTYNGTVLNPFINAPSIEEIDTSLSFMRSYLLVDASALGLGSTTVALTNWGDNGGNKVAEFNGLICSDDTVANAQGVDIYYTLSGEDYSTVTLDRCYFLSGGTLADLSPYASVLTTQLTIRKVVLT